MTIQTDILICGGGIAGLVATCAFSTAGFSVICIDPVIKSSTKYPLDLRTTALLQPAIECLKFIKIWQQLVPHASPLEIMRLIEVDKEKNSTLTAVDFHASEVSNQPFGWNLQNNHLRRALLKRIEQIPRADFKYATYLRTLTPRTAYAIASLNDNTQIKAKLVIAADGRNSRLREILEIDTKTCYYGQTAVIFSISHQQAHHNISTEIHQSDGPFTLVPLPDSDGLYHSSVVWTTTPASATALAKLDNAAFNDEINRRSCNILGALQVTTSRVFWPVLCCRANALYGPRTALIAEAAHVIPPIGAQGLNMSLKDISILLNLAQNAPTAIGNRAMLKTYAMQRSGDIACRIQGIDILSRIAITDIDLLKSLRLTGLNALKNIALLRRSLMFYGLGLSISRFNFN